MSTTETFEVTAEDIANGRGVAVEKDSRPCAVELAAMRHFDVDNMAASYQTLSFVKDDKHIFYTMNFELVSPLIKQLDAGAVVEPFTVIVNTDEE